ncbi:putative bifunctional diguanylate cyclase/phosphodiesterase [Rhizobium oryzicola]|uniref:EAL domain-containing protein n=1 Tax=Rhizobium oryzicola TaxID=1232668 RepID=A0ABT8T212_9HYPH|nr:EAL domain-containing protein [Rhizobium oryzicola]MDO1584671.1 EAL domain-containing protein [Rhizobium oryzicola]
MSVGVQPSQAVDEAFAVRQAQAIAVIRKALTPLILNLAVSASVVGLVYATQCPREGIWVWFAGIVATLTLRLALLLTIRKRDLATTHPLRTLRLVPAGNFLTGIAWGTLPFLIDGSANALMGNNVYLMLFGVTAGAALLNVEFSRPGIAFTLPAHIGACLSLLLYSGTTGLILCANLLLMTLIFYRSSRASERTYLENLTTELKATSLAQSLTAANVDILKANARLEDLANRDSLTHVANRAAFNTRLAEGISQAASNGEELALLILDIDRFKTINDTMGHRGGDELLRQFAERLRTTLPAQNIISRLGGDEFAVILAGKDAYGRAIQEAQAILEHSRAPFDLKGQCRMISSSIGIAVYPHHARNAEELFVSADMALHATKDRGRGTYTEFAPQMRAAAARQRQVEGDILQAIKAGAVETWFQPQVSLNTGRILGFEALVRWHHPQLGAISPPEIVQAAHNIQSSQVLTPAIADAACRMLKRLPSLGLPEATIAINVSPREFAMYSVPDMLDEVATRHGICRSLLEIEITEEALLDTEIAMAQLKQLETSGFLLAVDDFGAGHSSLTHLIDLKVDRLKIDRGLTTGIHLSPRNQAIISALISLGDALSMSVLAEGVETDEEADSLRQLGCEIGQGFLFSRALRADQLEPWVVAWRFRDNDADYAVA